MLEKEKIRRHLEESKAERKADARDREEADSSRRLEKALWRQSVRRAGKSCTL